MGKYAKTVVRVLTAGPRLEQESGVAGEEGKRPGDLWRHNERDRRSGASGGAPPPTPTAAAAATNAPAAAPTPTGGEKHGACIATASRCQPLTTALSVVIAQAPSSVALMYRLTAHQHQPQFMIHQPAQRSPSARLVPQPRVTTCLAYIDPVVVPSATHTDLLTETRPPVSRP